MIPYNKRDTTCCPQKSRAEQRLLIGSRFLEAAGNDCAGQGYTSVVMAQCHGGPWAPAPPRAQHLAVLSTLLLLAPHRAQPLDRLSTSPCTAASRCTQHLNTLSISPRSAPHRAQHLAMFIQHLAALSTLTHSASRRAQMFFLAKRGRSGGRLENWLCGSPWTQLQSTHKRCLLVSSECNHPQAAGDGLYLCTPKQTPAQFGCAFLS